MFQIKRPHLFILAITLIIIFLITGAGYILASWQTGTAVNNIFSAPRNGLIGYWNMDSNDVSGTTVYDKSGKGYNGITSGALSFVSGKIKQAVDLEKDNADNISLGSGIQNSLGGISEFSVSVWVKPESFVDNGGIIGFGNDASRQIWLYSVASGNSLYLSSYLDGNRKDIGSGGLVIGQWYHLVGTYSSSTGLMSLYINNVLTTSTIGTGTVSNGSTNNFIGKIIDYSYFDGLIDSVRIYDKELTRNQINNLYNATKINYIQSISRNALSLNLNFGNNNGTSVVYDTGPLGLNQTEVGTLTFNQSQNGFVENPGAGVNYLTGTGTGVYNTVSTTIAIKFLPDTGVSETAYRYLYDASVGSRYYAVKTNAAANSVFQIGMGNTLIESIPSSTYGQYWLAGQENILIVSGSSGNTNAWLNGNQILTNDTTAWTPTNPAVIRIGQIMSGTGYFDGKMYYFKVWQRILTSAERDIINADRTSFVK